MWKTSTGPARSTAAKRSAMPVTAAGCCGRDGWWAWAKVPATPGKPSIAIAGWAGSKSPRASTARICRSAECAAPCVSSILRSSAPKPPERTASRPSIGRGCETPSARGPREKWRNPPGAAPPSPGKSISTRRSTAFPIRMWLTWSTPSRRWLRSAPWWRRRCWPRALRSSSPRTWRTPICVGETSTPAPIRRGRGRRRSTFATARWRSFGRNRRSPWSPMRP